MRRKLFSRLLALGLTVVTSAALITGCGSKSGSTGGTTETTEGTLTEATKPASYDDELHIAVNASPENLDLFSTTAMQAQWMCTGTIFESLVTIDSEYAIHPELAESFTISDDARTYTYKLRSDVKFHDGTTMTAEDVVASLNHWIEKFSNAAAVCGDNRFEITGDMEVGITLTTPYLYLNELMVKGSQRAIIVPKSSIDSVDPSTGVLTSYTGTGPYKFTEWSTDKYILFTKFEDYCPYGSEGDLNGYYGYKVASTDKIYYDIVTDAATRTSGIQTGEYDFAVAMNMDDYGIFSGNSDYKIYTEASQQLILVFNNKSGIASNPDIRLAVNAALNCSDILKAAYVEDDFVRPGGALMLNSGSEFYSTAGLENYNQADAEKAKSMLEEAGYNGEEFRILFGNSYSDFSAAALVIQDNLKAAGVNAVIESVDWATYQTLSKDETAYECFITSCSMKAIPTQLYYLGSSAGWATENAELVELKTAFDTSTDKESAIAAASALQEWFWTEGLPTSVLGTKVSYCVSTDKVNNMYYFEGPHPWGVTVTE